MFRRFLGGVAAVAALLSAGAGMAQDISADRLSEHIRVLADDSFQGRVPGEVGEAMTLDYLQGQYEAMGLQPGGPDGQWLQPVTLFRFTPARVPVAHWTAPDGTQHPLVATDIQLRSSNDSGRVEIADAPVVFAGYGITAPERDWDDYGDLDVTGKVVIVLAGEPAGDLFRGDYNTAYSSAGYKKMEALRRGAVGVITLVLDEASWRGMAGRPARTRTTVEGLDPIPFTGTVGPQTAMQWGTAAGVDHGAMATVETGQFKAIEMTGVRLTVDIEESREEIQTYNLLARIEELSSGNRGMRLDLALAYGGLARCARRHHLQRRLGQCLGHGRYSGAGARLLALAPAETHRGVFTYGGRGNGPARRLCLFGQSGLSAGNHGRRPQHRHAAAQRPDP